MPAVRGLATHADPAVRRAAYAAELDAWPRVAVPCAAAMNAIKGEANIVNRRRRWASPLDASLFANCGRPGDVRRDAGRGPRLAARLPPLDAGQGPRCTADARTGLRVGRPRRPAAGRAGRA